MAREWLAAIEYCISLSLYADREELRLCRDQRRRGEDATYFVPGSVIFFGCGFCGRFGQFVSFVVRWVEVDHGKMVV